MSDTKRALVIGATGYVGSAICRDLQRHGYATVGLARSDAAMDTLRARGVSPLPGDLSETPDLVPRLKGFDVVVFAAMVPFDVETGILRELLRGLDGTGAALVFVSGSGVVSLPAEDGTWNENTFAEDDPFPFPALETRRKRVVTEQLVRQAGGVRTAVVRPPLIWGHGGSIQVPQLFESGRRTGEVCYLGEGLNLYSNVHVDDVATVCRLAAEAGRPGAVYHAVSGEANFRTIAEAVASVLDVPTRSLDYAAACDLWGQPWVDMGLAVNSRIRAPLTRDELGWRPLHTDLINDIRQGSYRDVYGLGGARRDAAYAWRGGHVREA